MIALTVYATAPHQIACGQAVAQGIQRIGGRSVVTREGGTLKTQHVACWGWRRGKTYRESGHDVLVMERAYLGDRFKWVSLGWNGLNGFATFHTKDDGGARFREHFGHLMQPWRPVGSGDYVLLVGQVPGDMSLRGRDLAPWYRQVAERARDIYDMPVVFRPHPQAAKLGHRAPAVPRATLSTGSLAEDLARAAVCVTWNSNTAVESVLAGVPTVSMCKGSMAYDVTGHTIGDMLRVPREDWAARLAWCQWLPEEIASGAPFWNFQNA